MKHRQAARPSPVQIPHPLNAEQSEIIVFRHYNFGVISKAPVNNENRLFQGLRSEFRANTKALFSPTEIQNLVKISDGPKLLQLRRNNKITPI